MFSAKLNEISVSPPRFWKDRLNLASLGLSLIINIIHLTLVYYKIRLLSSISLIHYNVVFGPDFVERTVYLYIIPATAFVFLILNLLLAVFFYRKEKLAAYFINFANVPIQLIFLIASIIIISANG